MTERDDHELLAEFARTGSEAAFGTLTGRYVNLVHSAAWRFTGNSHHAEEITQAVFIVLARKAGGLGRGTVLAGWLYQTARLTAANFTKAERRRREREQEAYMQSILTGPDPAAWEQIAPVLDEAMGRLSEADRNALVLRYFENRPAAAVAARLGVNEAAAHKRVNRALERLRKLFGKRGVTLSGAVIATAVGANSVQAAPAGLAVKVSVVAAAAKVSATSAGMGAGSKLLSVLGKSALFSWLVPLLMMVVVTLPNMAVMAVISRMERKNFRDADGFRPELHRRAFRSFLWGYPVLLVVALVGTGLLGKIFGFGWAFVALAGMGLVLTLISLRSLMISRNPFQIGMFVYGAIIWVGLGAVAVGWVPRQLSGLPMLVATIVFFGVYKKRPMRMDYSLFLRVAQGQVEVPAAGNGPVPDLDRRELLAFARFLGARYLVINFRWEASGLVLRLAPVRGRFLANMGTVFMPPISGNCSHITLRRDGTVAAHCGRPDFDELRSLKADGLPSPPELEAAVAGVAGRAWREFRAGRTAAAGRVVGESPEADVFVVSPGRSPAMRWSRGFLGGLIVLMLAAAGLQYLPPPAWMSGLRPVQITEAQVRVFLNDASPNPDPKIFKDNSSDLALFTCLALPSTNLYSAEGLKTMRDEVVQADGFEALRRSSGRAQSVFNISLLREAVARGWISWGDLNVRPDEVAAVLQRKNGSMYTSPGWQWNYLFSREAAWSWVESQRYEVMRIQGDGLAQLQLLRTVNCLNLVDREKLIQQIAAVQVLSGHPPGNPPIHDWKDVRGLFFTPCSPTLPDTYYSVAALAALDGLDRMDREACIAGILQRHRGEGYFTSPASGGFNEYHIDGSAQDTIAAYESLRILGALDRVKDLDRWQFRPQRQGVAKDQLTWHDVEAWICQQRLAEILKQHKEHPEQPYGSLLEPHGIY